MAPEREARYRLYYWPQIPGRGEFVRLILEQARLEYVDVGRLPDEEGGGADGVGEILHAETGQPPAFAPPVLETDELVISQTANICAYLARRHELIGENERDHLHANQLQLTLQDLLGEAHDTHHPISVGLYYEDQKQAASRRASAFVDERMPKYFDYFERTAGRGETWHLVDDQLSYVDLSMFQILRGLAYAFPNAFETYRSRIPTLTRLVEGVEQLVPLADYLASDRRLAFNEHGIFRHYPELDTE